MIAAFYIKNYYVPGCISVNQRLLRRTLQRQVILWSIEEKSSKACSNYYLCN